MKEVEKKSSLSWSLTFVAQNVIWTTPQRPIMAKDACFSIA